MQAAADTRHVAARPDHRATGRTPAATLFWRLFLLNGVVFVAGATILVLSPATVSAPVSVGEVAILTAGSALMLAVNASLLRANLKPLDGLAALMERVDLLRPGERLTVSGNPNVAHVISTFNDMLDRLETERETSSAQALAAQEGERHRIARELHDEIGQSLTAVLLGLKRIVDRAPEELRDELRNVQEMIRTSLEEVRQVARRLRPGVLEDLGLVSAINALAADFSTASEIPVDRRLDNGLPSLAWDTELVLYRIAQESLTNIARHSGATRVDLTLAGGQGVVTLRVTDDGKGLDGIRDGAGIRGMRERAILVGAKLTLKTGPSGGTEVRVIVPTGTKPGV